ncbi:hypothetical protein Tco_0016964 [Tanacetum coccineum]
MPVSQAETPLYLLELGLEPTIIVKRELGYVNIWSVEMEWGTREKEMFRKGLLAWRKEEIERKVKEKGRNRGKKREKREKGRREGKRDEKGGGKGGRGGKEERRKKDMNHESGNLLNLPSFPATNEFSSICEQDVGLEKEEAQVEDDDDGNIYNIWDITVEDVERIRQFLTPNVPDEMEKLIQPLIPQSIHTTPPNDDYVASATK